MDNFVSFNRFTSLDPNISVHGMTVEEFELQRGTPDPNPMLSPMARSAVTELRLGLATEGSDRLRLGVPVEPDVDPYQGPKQILVLSRNAERKLGSGIMAELKSLLSDDSIPDSNLRKLMRDSLSRAVGMGSYVAHINAMREMINANQLAASKG